MQIVNWFFSKPETQNAVLGISMSDDKVLWVRLVQNEKGILSIQGHGRITLSPGIVVSGSIQNPHELVRALLPLRIYHDIPVACALPLQHTDVFKISVPLVPNKDAEKLIEERITQHLAQMPKNSAQDAVCEYEIVDRSDTHILIYVTVYARSRAEAYRFVLERVGFQSTETYSLPASLARMHSETSDAYIMLDMGSTETHVAVVVGTRALFIKTVPVGQEDMIHTIQSYLSIHREEARKIFKRYGVTSTHRDPALRVELYNTLAPVMETLQAIMRAWDENVYSHQSEKVALSEIVVLGEGSHMRGLLDYLRHNTRLTSTMINVWRLFPEIQDLVPEVDWYDAPRFAPAIAVALERMRKSV